MAVLTLLALPASLVAQEGPWEREWEEIPIHQVFPGMDEDTQLPTDLRWRMYWDAEAGPVSEWHVFHMLMRVEQEGEEYRRFATSLVNCAERLLLETRETFIEGSDVVSDEGVEEALWPDRVRGLLSEDPARLRASFERWAVDAEAACRWLERRADEGFPGPRAGASVTP